MTATSLVSRALADAGLLPIAEARQARDQTRVDALLRELARTLETADLLLVGALADRIRADEAGDVVRIATTADAAADVGPDVVAVSLADAKKDPNRAGFPMLRKVALARIRGPFAARVRVDWSESGLEVAQVALGFGASELAGPIENRRGLPIAAGTTQKVKGQGMVEVQELKRKELTSLLALAGRRAVFVGQASSSSASPHVSTSDTTLDTTPTESPANA